MTDIAEKASTGGTDEGSQPQVFERPTGWRGVYYHPATQVAMVGFVCFMCPGLFNALTGLGAAGQVDSKTSANGNVALYSTFSVAGFFAGSINNKIGPRLTLQLGSIGYCLYISAFLATNYHPNAQPYVIVASAILGICAGLLWTAQGSLMLAYPTEAQKGKYIGLFWAIFNLGGVVGAAVAFGNNFHSEANAVGNGTYIGFLVLTLIGVTIPMFMANPEKMIRTDGTKVTNLRHPSWKTEVYGLWVALRTDPMIVLLFPMFFASNWFYTWQFNDYNGALFNIRTRGLNNMIYWTSQIVGSISIGLLLDQKSLRRRVRAFAGWGIVFCMVFIVHIWAYFYQKEYTRASILDESERMDFSDPKFPARIWLYIFMAWLDAMWQTTAYWMMGAMSNDPAKLAYFTGYYKSIQSAGSVGAWRADAVKLPYMNIFASTWALLVAGLLFALPMIHLRVKDHTDLEDEVIARMDESGNILTTEEVEAAEVHSPTKAEA